ncbi:MAG: shikimate dehydrogenase [Gemmataceae bacterium]|nr:shikimate dehydrogenase [Gemmataceae bacterium]
MPEHPHPSDAQATTPVTSEICVVIGRTRHKMMQIEIQEAAKRGARLIELRLDFLAKAPDFKRLLADKPCPMIATVRRPQDGGRWGGTEDERLTLLRQAIVAGFDWVDLETDMIDSVRRFGKVKRIVSYHNLRETPADLEEIYARMCKQDADLVKMAVAAQEPFDNLRVLDLLKKAPRPTVALCMGDLGTPSRVLGGRHGAPFTYAAFNKERGVAPGIVSFDEMTSLYRYPQIDAQTTVYGVIGDPIGHSLSPLIHNKTMHKLGINGIYLPFRVPRGSLAAFLKAFDQIGVRGYSVTIPHKEAAAVVASRHGPLVEQTQAANTLMRVEDGWEAYNTDTQAALESLQANLPPTPDGTPSSLGTRSVLILGAGGVARAIAHGLKGHVGTLTITNRTAERAVKLAEEVSCRTVDWGARHSVLCDLLINCTSVGMYPDMDETPVHHSFLRPGLMVFETIYTPETTLLVKEARARGCHVLTGIDMFVRQAALQFQLFTGREPPLELMRGIVKRALSPVAIREEE